jgi:hypothetical protein
MDNGQERAARQDFAGLPQDFGDLRSGMKRRFDEGAGSSSGPIDARKPLLTRAPL